MFFYVLKTKCNKYYKTFKIFIIAFGKKTQCCGIFCGTRIDEVEDNVFNISSRLNSTWGGNLADMVRLTLYLEIIENEGLVEK